MDSKIKLGTLTRFLFENGIRPRVAMNYLQSEGIVSDNAIFPDDVAEKDCSAAIRFLKPKLPLFRRAKAGARCGVCGNFFNFCSC
jgi:hypothetical protein